MQQRDSSRVWFAVGSLTRGATYFETANGKGITIVEFDAATGRFDTVSTTAGIDNPTHLCFDPDRMTLYANSEVEGWNEGTVSAYRLDPETGHLAYINKQPTLGSIAAHNSFSRSRRHLFVTNYSHEDGAEMPRRAMAVFPIADDGGLAPASASVVHEGRGPSEERQRVPHPHCAMISSDGTVVSVADLGLDRVLHYEFDDETGRLTVAPAGSTVLPPASGPRHFVEASDGKTIYVINELASTVAVMKREKGRASWTLVQILSTLPPGFVGENLCAAIHLSPDGRHLYGSNRGHDSLVCFAVDPDPGGLTVAGWTASAGCTPRSFALAPDGGHVIVANQNSDEIIALRRNRQTGALEFMDAKYRIGTPMCIIALGAPSTIPVE